MSTVFDQFTKKHDFLICVDSDGCVMDTMNCKHFHCFGPCLVDEWGLRQWEKEILRRWNYINLFQMTRGINRFQGLTMVLSEINERFTPIVGLDALCHWVDTTTALSNDSLETAILQQEDEDGRICLQKALLWSCAVNEDITKLPEELKSPFAGAAEAIAAAAEFADVVVISSANRDAVQEEWDKFGLSQYADLLITQDCGSKAYCIGKMLQFGYAKDHVIMVGDAPGDCEAAQKNDVWFYPVLVNWEEECWEVFRDKWLSVFQRGDYGIYQKEMQQVFVENLGG